MTEKRDSKANLERRTRRAFVTGITGVAAGILGLKWIASRGEEEGIYWPLRKMLRFNGTVFSGLFNVDRRAPQVPPNIGKEPRFNGDIGLADIADDWRLHLAGKDLEQKLTMEDVHRLPRSETSIQFKCIEGWSDDMTCAGTRFSDFMEHLGVGKKDATTYFSYVGLATPDGEYYVSIDMESMLHPQTLLCYEMNGMPISFDNGAPLRLIIPVKYGIKSLKQVGKIWFSDTRPPDYWAERGYDWYAGL